jgi:sulfoxide reductase heme-binding subunit YedZ
VSPHPGKIAVLAAGLAPAALLAVRAFGGDLGANPVETVTHFTGDWALRLLLLTLAITPARRLLGRPQLVRYRRMLGLLCFFYACVHVSTFAILDHFFDWRAMIEDVVKRPYITAGSVGFLCLLPLAVTSTRGWIRRLGKRWAQLHRLVYVAAAAAVVHYWWLVKADVRLPLLYGGVLAALLAVRTLVADRGHGQ